MKILHISDIHWRPLIRHEEYKIVFTEIFRKAKMLKVDRIIMCGDIVDEKTQRITPEVVDCLVWMFRNFSKIAITDIILGNHDGNLANRNRQDAISPIIDALNDDRIKLYKKSDVYDIDDEFSLCVFSPFDEKGWKDVKPKKGRINIALFHGSVQGAITDIGYHMQGEVEPNFFKDYDFALLGDIHRHQFLDKDKRIAYCGSTVQKDFGENIDGHGFLIWDIRSKYDFDVTLHEIENRKPFVTIKWAGNISKTMEKVSKYPDGSRFRIYHSEPLSQKDFSQIFNEIQRVKKSNHIVPQYDEKVVNQIDKDMANSLKRNLREPSVIMKLLKEFYNKDDFTEQQWKTIEETLWNYVKDLNPEKDEVNRNIIWSPVRMEFSNIMNYGEDNVIDFRSLGGIIGIFGPNALGKSTILAAMAYALFGKLDREININHNHGIVNIRKTECSCKFMFRVGGTHYSIYRKTQRIDKPDGRLGSKGSIDFLVVDEFGNEIRSLNGETPTETDKEIRKIVGTIDDFKITALAPQKKLESFIEDYKTTERKKKLYKFRDLHVLQEFHTKSLNDFKGIKSALRLFDPIDWDTSLMELENEEKQLNKSTIDISDALQVDEAIRDKLREKLSTRTDHELITEEQVENKQRFVSDLEEQQEKIKEQIKITSETKYELESTLEDVYTRKGNIPVKTIKAKLKKKIELDNQIIKLKENLSSEKNILKSKKKTVSKLDVVPCGDQYPTCKYIIDAHQEKNNIKPQKELIESLEKQVQKLEILIVDDEDYHDQLKKYDFLCEKEMSLVKKISILSVENYETKLEYNKERLKKEKNELTYLVANVSSDVTKETKNIKLKLSKVEQDIKDKDSERIRIAGRLGSIGAETKKMKEDKDKFEDIQEKYKIYEKLAYAFGNKGIPNQIIRMDLPGLNAEISNVLRGAVNFDIELDVEEESDKLEIYINYGDSKRPIELCSGMEKAIAALAIRVGLLNASSLAKPDFLALDEAFDGLDESHIDSFVSVINSLKKWFGNIIIISHKESIKSMADHLLEITKKGKDSYICQE